MLPVGTDLSLLDFHRQKGTRVRIGDGKKVRLVDIANLPDLHPTMSSHAEDPDEDDD